MKYLTPFVCSGLVWVSLVANAAQIVTPAQTSIAVTSVDNVSFVPVYSVSSPNDAAETGLGMRIHFDSTALQFTGVQNVFAYGVQPQGEITADTENLDGDTATDSYVVLGWLDTSAQWPGVGELPLDLASVSFTPATNFAGTTRIRATATATSGDASFQNTPMAITVAANDQVSASVRGFLQGAYSAVDSLMQDNLREKGVLPIAQPYNSWGYAGTETATAEMFATTGSDAPVDWVLLELRDKLNPDVLVASKAALLQRDGDVVDAATGNQVISFNGLEVDRYYLALKHRNHLGVMTATPVNFPDSPATIDFALSTTSVYGTQDIRAQQGDKLLLPAGDASNDRKLIAEGPGNDRNTILGQVLASPENPDTYVNYQLQGYATTDLNMDGKTLFVGPGNDVNILLGNILMAPDNATFSTNYILQGTSPD